jgi:hypothetical protein
LQHDGVDEGKNRRIGADAHGKRKHRDQGKHGRSPELPETVVHIFDECFDPKHRAPSSLFTL